MRSTFHLRAVAKAVRFRIREMEFQLLIFISFALVTSSLAQNTSLRFVTVIWRHGDRSPSSTFPTDITNREESWPQGFGELSKIGMEQHQILGQYLRQRYIVDAKFLSDKYSAYEIYVRSSSYNRTIMSAMANLAGMYPLANGAGIFDTDGDWQPIPVHSQPREIDPMLWTECHCPTANDVYWNEVMESDEVKKLDQENKEFFDFLKQNTGLQTVRLHHTWEIWDPLYCEKLHNHTWPSWVTEEVYENLTELMHLSVKFYYRNPKMQRFRGSLLFEDIAIRMDQKARRSAELGRANLKYFVYSAHDTTLAALMENLGAFNGKLPEYASAIMIELHEKVLGTLTVETWYLNETGAAAPPVRLAVKGCGEECSLKKFVELAKSNVPEDWYAECGLKVADGRMSTTGTTVAIAMGILAGIFLLAFLGVLVSFFRLKNGLKSGIHQADMDVKTIPSN